MSDIHTILNRYQLKDEIGEGGMGKVFRAYDRLTGKDVALKQVTTDRNQFEVISRAPTGSNLDQALAHEFRLLSSLRHPNIISVLDYGFDEQRQPFFTMNLLENVRTIHEACVDKSQKEQIAFLVQMLQALHYLHRHGMLHRDLKPANVLVVDDHVYLLDFGLAFDSTFAKSRDVGGTLPYMPPEVLAGNPVSEATDLYSLGVMAHEILIGKHPFDVSSQTTLISQILSEPVHIASDLLDDALAAVLMRLLSKDPEERYASALDTMRALCQAGDYPLPEETAAIRESFITAAKFVGRKPELEQLQQALDDTVAGKGSAWLIGGESGVGKSRLLDEVRIAALVNGALVVRGFATVDTDLTYRVLRDVLPRLVLSVSFEDDEMHILRQLVPHIEHLVGRTIPNDLTLDDETLKNRLPLVLVDLISRVADQQPLVLILEDLQWANESLDILKLLIPLTAHTKLLILGNYRNDEAPRLPELLSDMKHIELNRMSDVEIRALSMSMLGDAGDRTDVVNLLQRETEGNTFFIVEVVRALAAEAGQLDNIGRVTIPAQIFAGGVQRVVERRLSQLPEWTRDMVNIAAVAGRQIDRQIMAYINPEIDLDRWLEACAEAAVFDVQGEQWLFSHDKLREQLLANLLDVETRRLHEKVGEAIESYYPDSLQDYAEVLMKHFAIAKNVKKEGKYAAMACEPTLKLSPQNALNYALRAIELAGQQCANNPQAELARLHYVAGCANVRLSQYDAAKECLQTSNQIATDTGYQLGIAQSNNVRGELFGMLGQYREAIALVESSIKIFRELNDLTHIYYALTNLAISNFQLGNVEQANHYFLEAVEVISKGSNPVALAQAYNNYAIVLNHSGDTEAAFDIHERALTIRRHYKDQAGVASSLTNLGSLKADMGHIEEAKQMMNEGIETYARLGGKRNQARALEALANVCRNYGQFHEALTHYEQALSLVQQLDIQADIVSIQVNMGLVYLLQSDVTGAYEKAMKAANLLPVLDLVPYKIEVILLCALIKWEQQDYVNSAQWLGLVKKHREMITHRRTLDTALETVEENMGSDIVDAMIAQGEALDVDVLIKEILEKDKHEQ